MSCAVVALGLLARGGVESIYEKAKLSTALGLCFGIMVAARRSVELTDAVGTGRNVRDTSA